MLSTWRKSLIEPIVLAIILTSIFYATFDKQPHYDAVRNLIVAQEITQRGIPTYFDSVYWQHPPLLHYSIAIVSKLFNSHVYYGAKIVILGLSFLSLVMFYLFCNELYGKDFARLSVLMLAVTPMFWSNANDIMQAMGELFFFTSTLYFFYRATKTGEKRHYLLSGVFFGLGMLMRVSAIVLVPIMIAYVVFEKKRTNGSIAIKSLIIMFFIACLVFTPYFIYRTINGGPSIFNQAVEETLKGKAGWLASGDLSSPPLYYITDFFSIASFTTIFLIIGLYFAFKRKDNGLSLPFLWFSITMIVLSILSHKENRFMIIGLPAIIMMGSYGVFGLKEYFKKNEKLFYVIPAILLIALFYSGFRMNTNDGYWPFNFEVWQYINALDNDVVSKDIYGAGFNMPYGIVKLLTNKYSDYVPPDNNPQAGIYSAISFNTPYILYPGDPVRSENFVKVKHFDDCNCTLYKVNISFSGTDFRILDENGNLLNGATFDLFDSSGKHIFGSKANSLGIVRIPLDNFIGILSVDKICYSPLQGIIKIENGIFNVCSQKQTYGGFTLQNTLDCKPQGTDIMLSYKGCLNHNYARSRF